ncbi:MAG: hypothetical protein H0W89_00565 [Candidatus Levybacteria bacterium]|nr:hypothetical protein [Candidatus Levybacteria bacterium]
MDIPHINPEKKSEVVTDAKETPKETKALNLYSDLNSESMSTKKLLALTGGVLSVALLAIFLINSFMLSPKDTSKNVDLKKNETKASPTIKEEVKGAEGFASPETSRDEKVNTTVQLPKKPTATKAPVATQAPTKQPDPTAAPTAQPTSVPTAVPTVAPTIAPTTTEITPIPTI